MSNVPELKYVPWVSGDDSLAELLTVMSRFRESQVSPEWLAQKLSWGLGGVGALAYDGDLPVGLVLFGAAPIELGDKGVNVALSYDTFVDKDYRGRGLFTKLLSLAEEVSNSRGFDFLLNFPNSSSKPGFIKAGWKPLLPMRRYVRPVLRPSRAASLLRFRSAMAEGFVPDQEVEIGARAQSWFSASVERSGQLRHSVTASALEFRFSPDRGHGYREAGTSEIGAIVRTGKRGALREVQILVTSTRPPLVAEMRKLSRSVAREFGADIVTYLESLPNPRPWDLIRAGFFNIGTSTTPFFKGFTVSDPPQSWVLGGIDIHTW